MTSGLPKSRSAFDISHIVNGNSGLDSSNESSLLLGFLSAKRTAQHLKRRAIHITEQARRRRDDFRGESEVCHSAEPIRSADSSRLTSRHTNSSASDLYKIRSTTAFPAEDVERIIRHIVNKELDDKTYQHDYCRQQSSELAEKIKDGVKKLHLPRYRLICYVNIGQKSGQCISVTSQCLWDDNLDNYASYCFQNASLYAVCVVYAVYYQVISKYLMKIGKNNDDPDFLYYLISSDRNLESITFLELKPSLNFMIREYIYK
ncbi:Tctex1 domain-containing protein 1 [Trichoplax sp. H2]|nr:Tctex1 domain-containing protein 1 [Trichoplax sp. H2]|eukprot:RDD46239.1 Tctex1 domain-containing protein 1 [Trichoplax sp. H2]